ncbi:MAG: GNAT family N-acetyltransferase [Roseococcus sp.]|nr:GNAT family N-acetyltransferase [Roseococcus sp.]
MTVSDAPGVVVGAISPGPLADQVLDLAATGRAGLAALLGDAAQRHAIFRPAIRPDRFLVATVGGELAGYLSLKYAGQGPFAPGIGDFIRYHGWRRGLHGWAVFSAIEARSRPRRGGAYLYGIDVLEGFRGRARFPPHGVGGALIDAAIRRSATLGLAPLEMETRNPAARALMTRMGARPVVARPLSWTGLLMATAGEYERLAITIPPHQEARHGH